VSPVGKWVATGYVYLVWARYPVLAGKRASFGPL